MNNSFLDYYKVVLEKVSFDSGLFGKEFRKAMNTLSVEEQESLKKWVDQQGILNRSLSPVISD